MVRNILNDQRYGIGAGLRNLAGNAGEYGVIWVFLWLPTYVMTKNFGGNLWEGAAFALTNLLFLLTFVWAQMYPMRFSRMIHLCPVTEQEMREYLICSYRIKVGFSFAAFGILMCGCVGLGLYTLPQALAYQVYLLILAVEENITSPVLWQDKRNSSYGLAKLCTRVFFVIGYIFVLVIMSEKTAFTRTDDKVCIVTVIVVNGLAAIRLYHAFFQKAIEAAIQEYD